MEWKCQICKDKRPDMNISVFVKPLIVQGKEIGKQNIKYCNDRPACREAAPTYDYMRRPMC